MEEARSTSRSPSRRSSSASPTACDLYFEVARTRPRTTSSGEVQGGVHLYRHNHFEDAAKRYYEIIDKWPQNEIAQKATRLILDPFIIQKDWANLNKYSRGFLKHEALTKNAAFKKELTDLVQKASYMEILVADEHGQELLKDGKKEEAAQIFAKSRTGSAPT